MFNRCLSRASAPLSRAVAYARGWQLLLVAVLLIVALGIALPQPARAGLAVSPGDLSPDGLLNPGGALGLSGWQAILDGERAPRLDPAYLPNAPQADAWNALANQGFFNGQVLAFAVSGSDLYVGGYFSQTGDGTLTNLGNIARYDTLTKTWHALPNQDLSAIVWALAMSGSDLYVGGGFAHAGDGTMPDLNSIARFDTVTNTWHALPKQGLSGEVYALEVLGNNLYVGGIINQTGDGTIANLGNIVRYNMVSDGWFLMPNQGFNHKVSAMVASGSSLYVGGFFDQTVDGTLTNLGYMARFDGAFHALSNQGLYSSVSNGVRALAADGSDLYVGGGFTQTGDGTLTNLGRIARYNTLTNTWSALPKQGLNDTVFALAVDGTDLYVGGYITATGDGTLANLGRVARYDTSANAWHALPSQGLGASGAGVCKVDVLRADGGNLYVGGGFTQTGDGTLADLGGIARFGAPLDASVYLPLVFK